MKKIVPISLILFLFFCQSVSAQHNFVEGKVMFQNGDTLVGYVDYRDWVRNPTKILFKESVTQKTNTFQPTEIKGFHVENRRYVSATVKIETSNSHTIELDEDSLFHIGETTAFLQVLVEGIKGLYYLNDVNDKEHFYIRKEGEFELIKYKRYIKHVHERHPLEDFWVKETHIYTTHNHVFHLMTYLDQCSYIDIKLQKLPYTRKSMEDLFKAYYACISQKPSYRITAGKILIKPGIIAGLSSSNLKFQSNIFKLLSNADFPRSNRATAGISLEFILPGNHRRWSFNNELSYNSYLTEGSYEDRINENRYSITSISFGQNFIKLSNGLRYTYPLTQAISLYLNSGFSNYFVLKQYNSSIKENWIFESRTVTEEKLFALTRPHELELFLGLGTRVKNFSLEIRAEQGNGPSDQGSIKTKMRRAYLLLGYRF